MVIGDIVIYNARLFPNKVGIVDERFLLYQYGQHGAQIGNFLVLGFELVERIHEVFSVCNPYQLP